METSAILAWTLVSECPIPDDVTDLLVPGERAIAAYKTMRDSAVFTTRRLIVRDAQGLRGKKVEIYSLPSTAPTRNWPAPQIPTTSSFMPVLNNCSGWLIGQHTPNDRQECGQEPR